MSTTVVSESVLACRQTVTGLCVLMRQVRTRRGGGEHGAQNENSWRCLVVPVCEGEDGVSISLPPPSDGVRSLEFKLAVGAGLNHIPQCVAGYPALRKLRLSCLTEVTVWPPWLGTLSTLQDLSVEGSGLQQLPQAVRGLGGLTTLNVASNRLTELPSWLARCTKLLSLQVKTLRARAATTRARADTRGWGFARQATTASRACRVG